MPKYGASREMSQSARPLASGASPNHSRALFATSGCRRPCCVQPRRNSTQAGSDNLKKKCSEDFKHRLGAGQRGIRIDQVGRRIDRAAHFACVAELILRAADRAGAFDVAVGQEHRLHRVVELLDRLRVDQARRLELAIDVLRQLDVLRRVGRVPVIEADVESREVLRPRRRDARDERLRRNAFGLGLQHDRRAMRVVGADEVDFRHPASAGSAPRCRPGCTP